MIEKSLEKDEIELLVLQAQKGHEAAFESVYEYFFPRIFRFVSFRVEREHTEDLVADIFLKIVENLQKYKPQKDSSFSAWVFRIAHYHIIDFYRKQREILISEDSEEETENPFDQIPDENNLPPDQALEHLSQIQEVRDYLSTLKPSYREILELRYLHDLSPKEIAEVTGKTEGNIRIIQLRALKELREKIESRK